MGGFILKNTNCKLCGIDNSKLLAKAEKRPDCEINYNIPEHEYYREIRECNSCGVTFNIHDNLLSQDFYDGFYNASIEKDMNERFLRIINFPFNKSDNKHRVLRIINFLYKQDKLRNKYKLLDVGSGTGVFLHEIKKFGLEVNSLDPDKKAIDHINKSIGIKNTYCGDFLQTEINKKFDIITFNKVLEHVNNPVEHLLKAKRLLSDNGCIYIELPNAEPSLIKKDFLQRAEFNIEHHTIYTYKSLRFLIEKSGLKSIELHETIDPSGKQTIFSFSS